MVPGSETVAGAFVGALLAGAGTYMVTRIQLEQRLVRLETNLGNHPLKGLDDRLRTVEFEVSSLAPFRDVIQRHGAAGVEARFTETESP